MIYPLIRLQHWVSTTCQVQKAARKEQRVAVCVVQAADGSGGHSYLLVKRAEKGLLAGQACVNAYLFAASSMPGHGVCLCSSSLRARACAPIIRREGHALR